MLETVSGLQVILAVTPVILLIVLLGFLKLPGEKSASITLVVTALIALFGFNLSLIDTSLSVVYGIVKAVFPILIIILMAIYSYNVQVESQKIEIIKQQFSAISTDKSIQVLLLTWGFGGLLEGMAGFGTAVAIPAAILISLGFKPMFSAVVSLIANSVPTAFGAVGIPVIVLAREVEMVEQITTISAHVVWQLAVLMFLVPFLIVTLADKSVKAIPKNIILSLLVGGVTLAVQYYAAVYIGAETPAILGSIASVITIILFGKITAKKEGKIEKHSFSLLSIFQAWSVYGLILLLVLLTSPLFPFATMMKSNWEIFQTNFNFNIAGGIRTVGIYWLTDTGVLIFVSSLIGGLIQGVSLSGLFALLGKTTVQLKKTVITVCCLIALSTLMDLSGMITVLGLALATATGAFYPFFAPAIGALGTFLTGSDTSSNILFGKLQATVADKIGADKGWLAAANTTGATGGKIISPQSIAVATTACGEQGKEGIILKKAVGFALLYILIAGLIVYIGS
ncbi:L-lactate permease [Myroides profundi]|uniref:L-lactate permease n=1 Tax=Myroides profundi TaxID=480520 RepID=A0AAJ5BEN6_MYRPR|nr:L-lactate permease [Myroides profundi]AJH15165.1 lactate transporter, LctP family [Myroides profundi]SER22733.1 lactate permease [Myroides profundi]